MKRFRTILTAFTLLMAANAFAGGYSGGKATATVSTTAGNTTYKSERVAANVDTKTGQVHMYFKWDTFKASTPAQSSRLYSLMSLGGIPVLDITGRFSAPLPTIGEKPVQARLKGTISYADVKRPIELPVTIRRQGKELIYTLETSLQLDASLALAAEVSSQGIIQPLRLTLTASTPIQ